MADYDKIAREVLKDVGGADNVVSATHCVTRLRLILKDINLADQDALNNIEGTKGVIYNSGQLQIVFGPGAVENAYDAFVKVSGAKQVSVDQIKDEGAQNKNKFQQAFKVFGDIFIPIIPAFIGAAMILGLRSLLATPGMFGMTKSLAEQSVYVGDFCKFLNVIATTFKILPVLVMYSATKRFGGNPILGILVGFVMISPDLADRNAFVLGKVHPEYWNLFGLKIAAVGFQGGVFAAILTAWFQAKVEKLAKKYVPEMISYILVPMITLLAANLSLFLLFGPLGLWIGDVLGGVINFLYMKMSAFGAFVFAAGLQPLVVTGTHQAIQGIEANLIVQTGFDYIQPIWSVSIIAQGGGCIGMYLILKQKSKDRDIAISSFIPTLVGITEPAIFAVNLKYSIVPFVCSFIGAGFGGVYMKLFNVKGLAQGLTVLPGLTVARPIGPYIIGNLIAFILPIFFILIWNKFRPILPENKRRVNHKESEILVPTDDNSVLAPVDGEYLPLTQVNDKTFSQKLVGDGFAIEPVTGDVFAPVSGKVISVFPTKHAITLESENGVQILLHMGIDTVDLGGKGFTVLVKDGQDIAAGDPLAKMDLQAIKDAGKQTTVLVLFPDYQKGFNVKNTATEVSHGNLMIELNK
ncbi:PTS transporter subunit EIIC [Lactobacillus panisapium]|uniref:PTS transporter subunit EIIC n=1 Tax=Lactobacillus panisapium TaxID=2012495 RepID=A0ABX8W3E3_9LACO|nr:MULTISPECIES: PTS transporter subunit IIBCA [Lactobacillus]MCO6531853.1 PTS glucose transporter subunit IIA [Lactobacillus sp.]QYN52054.1 PTS transporter subunit EIIC [Lactobacillus panisapium]QYN57880.1 PTS transporter subunit EIIC [Lactobacillus panisapium]